MFISIDQQTTCLFLDGVKSLILSDDTSQTHENARLEPTGLRSNYLESAKLSQNIRMKEFGAAFSNQTLLKSKNGKYNADVSYNGFVLQYSPT